MSVTQKNYYKILQVDPAADFAVIKAAYRTLMLELKHHPDYGGYTNTAQEINEAYNVLKDPIQRKQYDRNNYFSLKGSDQQSPQRRYYYMRCYFCGTINRINLNTSSKKLQGITCGKCHSPFFSEQLDNHKIKRQKRQYERYLCDFDIKIQLHYGGEYVQGKCRDFSEKGMYFSTKAKLTHNRVVKIVFCHDESFQTIGKVLRARRLINDDGETYECAVLFIEAHCDKTV